MGDTGSVGVSPRRDSETRIPTRLLYNGLFVWGRETLDEMMGHFHFLVYRFMYKGNGEENL